MAEPINAQNHRFFAAANSGGGFKNYFDDIFPSDRHNGVFILKGGPGTGKSTLLREAVDRFSCPNIEVEIFHCSSDPKSLDGVIFRYGERSACILDGTAPHERDARLPGATDEIINLGECFDTRCLRAKKAEILSLQQKKSHAYKEAYFYLRLFSIFEENIKAEIEKRLKRDAVKVWLQQHFHKKSNAEFSVRPFKAFCKDGIVSLDSYEKIAKETVFIQGDPMECAVLLSEIYSLLSKEGQGGYYAPSPLIPDLLDGLLLNDFKTAVVITECERPDGIIASEFFFSQDDTAKEKIEKYKKEAARFLTAAKEALAVASTHHFELEQIYTPAMHFEQMRPMKEALFKKIGAILGLTEFS